jgi:polysaccharide biosynthesis/export protein VpsN
MIRKMIKAFILISLFVVSGAYAEDSYKIGAGDTVRISVYGEEDLSFEEYLIDSSESIDYPYLGEIKLGGKTLKQAQELITNGLKNGYLIDPKVTINVVKYRSIYVNGVVNKPGAYEYQPGLTVQKAIAMAGGFLAKYRKTKGIYVTKSKETEGMSEEQVNQFLKDKKEANLNDAIGAGDTIYVVSSFW